MHGVGAPRVLDPDDPMWPSPLRRAAVMVMLHGDPAIVPMIVRGDTAPVHGGQTALPGGRWEPHDASMIATALREVEEEVGVPASRLEILGELDDIPTRTGFLIRPVIARLDALDFVPDPREVAGIFTVPLARFTAPFDEDLGVRELGRVSYPLHAYRHEGRRIWGVAARVLELVAALAQLEPYGSANAVPPMTDR